MSEKRSDRSDLKSELNSIWRSTLRQFDEIKEVIVESSSAGKARIDAALLKREREHKLAEIGEAMLVLVEEGRVELPDGLKETVARLQEIEAEIESQEGEFRRVFGRDRERASARKSEAEGHEPEAEAAEAAEAAETDDEDGARSGT